MPQDQNIEPRPSQSMQNAIGCVTAIVVAVASLLSYVWLQNYLSCGIAPNGLQLSKRVPISGNRFEPYISIRDGKGTLLTYGEGDISYWSIRGFAGRTINSDGSGLPNFVYNNNIGFIFEKDDPQTFQKFYDKTKPSSKEEGIVANSNLYYYYNAFRYGYPSQEKWRNMKRWCW